MDKTAVLQTLAYLHNKLLTVQFYPEEFKQADASLKLIQEMATKLDEEIRNSESSVVVNE